MNDILRTLLLVSVSLILIVGSYVASGRMMGSKPGRRSAYVATFVGVLLVIVGAVAFVQNYEVTGNLWMTFAGIVLMEFGVGVTLAAQIRGNLTRPQHL